MPVINKIEKLHFAPVHLEKDNVYGKDAFIRSSSLSLEDTISAALQLKKDLAQDFVHKPGQFPNSFSNYLKGWNSKDEEYSEQDPKLLYLNIDLEDSGCTRKCSHCFTMAGQIDVERGRKSSGCAPRVKKKMPKTRLIEQIAKAKAELGLKAVRILGRGEPTESPYLLEFTRIMNELGVVTVIFTRGHVIGNDTHTKIVFGKYGYNTGKQVVDKLNELNASIVLGYSALDDTIHDGMTGIHSHSYYSRQGLKLFLDAGFNKSNPTRIAIEAPIAKINMNEMPVSYLLFQLLNISPIFNTYMVTGRADENYFQSNTPTMEERIYLHAEVLYYMKRLGINSDIGPYLGTKKCHDVSHGLYIPSSGDIRPCTGYESTKSIQGDLTEESIVDIWNRSLLKGKQSLCPPKLNHGFPLNYSDLTHDCLSKNKFVFEKRYQKIIQALNLN